MAWLSGNMSLKSGLFGFLGRCGLLGLRCSQAFVILRGVRVKIVVSLGKTMISTLSVVVLGASLAQPLQLSGLSFVIVSWLKFVIFVVLPMRKQCRGMSG